MDNQIVECTRMLSYFMYTDTIAVWIETESLPITIIEKSDTLKYLRNEYIYHEKIKGWNLSIFW